MSAPARGFILANEFLTRRYPKRLYKILSRDPPAELRFRKDGITLCVPWGFAYYYLCTDYESETVEWLVGRLNRGSVAIDVGAHVGYFTMLMARLVGPAGLVFAWEPAVDNLRFLRKNVQLNRARNVKVVPFAAGKHSGIREFYIKDSSDICSFYAHPLDRASMSITDKVRVREVPLDEICPHHVDVVKVDVEGAELEVLEGMGKIVASNPGLSLVVEWHPSNQLAAGHAIDALPKYLAERGYQLRVVDGKRGEHEGVRDVLESAKSGSLDPTWYCNLLCEHADRETIPRER